MPRSRQNILLNFQLKNEASRANYISQTPFEIYETTNGRNFPVSASNHFLTPTEGRTPLKKQYKGPGYTHKALVPRSLRPMMPRWLFSLCFKPFGKFFAFLTNSNRFSG